jgi:hypothetical protein
MPRYDSQPRVVAVLGPTNTGKTYLAIERMLGHGSGMIGFPLRLLARENYDRVVRLRGPGCAALVTGEEKIVPPHARYFLCTVESMPLDRPVSFLAIDEVQLAADPDRGHVFTDRLLRARGLDETMFLGAETIRPLIRRLSSPAPVSRRWPTPGRRRSRGSPRAAPSWPSPQATSTPSPSSCAASGAALRWCWGRSAPGSATPRSPCTSRERSTA